jgi:DNA-binding beta-propeller fold protein YncE
VHDSQIYLTDALRGQVLVFNREDLSFSHALGNPNIENRDLFIPSDVAVDPDGKVFVTSTRAKAVVSFQ